MTKYLVDTCGWIEWLTDGTLREQFAPYFEAESQLLMPTLVQNELFKWMLREKNESVAFSVIGVTARCKVVELTTAIALRAAELSLKHKLATADSIIYATCQQYRLPLVTCDAHFQLLEGVIYFKKSAS